MLRSTKNTESKYSRTSLLVICGLVAAAAASLTQQASAELVVHDAGDFRSHTIFFGFQSGQVADEHFEGADFELWPGDVEWARIRGYGYPTTQGAVMIESEFGLPTTVRRLSEGDTVDSSGIWGAYDDWQNPGAGWETTATFLTFYHGQRGYIGLRLTNKGSTPSYNYGWADVTFHNDGAGLFTLHRWAIETEVGKPVVVLPPEPPSEPPTLQVEWDVDRALISWPAPATGWVLQVSENLSNWASAGASPQLV
ncbi:MAG: hypothetical protein ACK4UN_22485, partial [Limisphaerales bacterium]